MHIVIACLSVCLSVRPTLTCLERFLQLLDPVAYMTHGPKVMVKFTTDKFMSIIRVGSITPTCVDGVWNNLAGTFIRWQQCLRTRPRVPSSRLQIKNVHYLCLLNNCIIVSGQYVMFRRTSQLLGRYVHREDNMCRIHDSMSSVPRKVSWLRMGPPHSRLSYLLQ